MSNKSVRVASDLTRFRCLLEIHCLCGNQRWMGGVEALRMFGNAPITSYAGRLRCSRCGRKLAMVTVAPMPQR